MTNDYLAQRYGTTKGKAKIQRTIWIIVGASLIIAFLIWSSVINFAAPTKFTATIHNFTVLDAQQTKVTIFVANPAAQHGVCAVKVLNSGFSVVGYKEIEVAPALGKAPKIDTLVNTIGLGVSASVKNCWLK